MVLTAKKNTAKRTWLLCVSEPQCVERLGLSVTPLRQSAVWGSELTVIQREKQPFTPNWGFKWLFIQAYVTTLSVPPTGADRGSAPVRPAHPVWGPWPVLQNVWTRYVNTHPLSWLSRASCEEVVCLVFCYQPWDGYDHPFSTEAVQVLVRSQFLLWIRFQRRRTGSRAGKLAAALFGL